MSTEYRAYYIGAEPAYIIRADNKEFPLRATLAEAVKDARDYWHKEGQHITPYKVEGDTVTELRIRLHRKTEVEVAK